MLLRFINFRKRRVVDFLLTFKSGRYGQRKEGGGLASWAATSVSGVEETTSEAAAAWSMAATLAPLAATLVTTGDRGMVARPGVRSPHGELGDTRPTLGIIAAGDGLFCFGASGDTSSSCVTEAEPSPTSS